MSKEEIIVRLVCSLNARGLTCGMAVERALQQYEEMVKVGIIKEEEGKDGEIH